MTGHSINAGENQEFLSTMHTMIDDVDTISSNIDENTYLRLVNGLQRLYNIHNPGAQSTTTAQATTSTTNTTTTTTTNTNSNNSNNRESWDQMQRETLRMNSVAQNITGALVRHYERVNDISNIHVNSDVYPLISNDHVNVDAYPVTNNNNNENIQSRIQSLNEESNRIGYSTRTRLALYNNVFNA